MRFITIETAQNINIDFELPKVLDRAIAYILDALIVLVISMIFVPILFGKSDYSPWLWVIFVLFGIDGPYVVLMEWLNNGQTLGKKVMGLKVVTTTGKSPSFIDYFTRWLLRPLETGLSLGGVAVISVLSTPKGQRLGGLLSNTTVIKTEPSIAVNLNLKKYKVNLDQVIYPLAGTLSEKDMVLVKKVLNRYYEFPNQSATMKLGTSCAYKIAEIMNEEEKPKKPKAFLEQVLKDYIILTR